MHIEWNTFSIFWWSLNMKITYLVKQRRFNSIVWILCGVCLINGLPVGIFAGNNQTCRLNTVRDDVKLILWYKAVATLGIIKYGKVLLCGDGRCVSNFEYNFQNHYTVELLTHTQRNRSNVNATDAMTSQRWLIYGHKSLFEPALTDLYHHKMSLCLNEFIARGNKNKC